MLPIDKLKVERIEEQNDGSHIYLHLEANSAVWVACGDSAYLLRLFVKKIGCSYLCGYSDRLQMPCVLVDADVARKVKSYLVVEPCDDSSLLCLSGCGDIDKVDYARWVDKLCQTKALDSKEITTPVSKQVPKDRYIPDGMSSFSRNVKRLFDCLAAFVAMIVFSPLYLVCYVLIKREDGGPAIYKQERIGRFGRPFYIYKFRSMRMDAEHMGPQLSHAGGNSDPRLTKIGKYIRAHHLDELPQLYNVFTGDMSFVGPRPERKYFIDKIMEHDKNYEYIYKMRPGLTSEATVYNGYTDTMEKMLIRLKMDLNYWQKRSLWMDIKIIFITVMSIINGKKF